MCNQYTYCICLTGRIILYSRFLKEDVFNKSPKKRKTTLIFTKGSTKGIIYITMKREEKGKSMTTIS